MAQQHINYGNAPDGAGGDNRRAALEKLEANDTELYGLAAANGAAAAAAQTTANNVQAALTAQRASFKNRIINGNFDFWQRGASVTTSSANGYLTADRWKHFVAGSSLTSAQLLFAPGQTAVPDNSYTAHRTVVTSVAGASNAVVMSQFIEDVAQLSGKTITVSFWAKADAAKNIAVELQQNFGGGGSPSASVSDGGRLIALSTVWKKYSFTTTVASIAGKTLGTNGPTTSATALAFWFDAGSNFSGRAAGLGQQSGTFDISQVQLEEGTSATAFELRPAAIELVMCQRYCYSQLLPPGGAFAVGHQYSGTGAMAQVNVPVSMRSAAPTLTIGGSIRWAGAATGSTNPTLAVGTPSQFLLLFAVSGGAQYSGGYAAANGGAAQLTFDAEL